MLDLDKKYSFEKDEADSIFILSKRISDSINYNITTSINQPLLKTQTITSKNKVLSLTHNKYNPLNKNNNNIMFPFLLNFIVSEEKKVLRNVELSYIKIKTNEYLLFPFSIPTDYEAIY